MFTLFVLFVFAWLFVKSVGLAFHVFAVVGALLPLLLPLALVAAAFCILKKA